MEQVCCDILGVSVPPLPEVRGVELLRPLPTLTSHRSVSWSMRRVLSKMMTSRGAEPTTAFLLPEQIVGELRTLEPGS